MSFTDQVNLRTAVMKFLYFHSFDENFLENLLKKLKELSWQTQDSYHKFTFTFKIDDKNSELIKIFHEFVDFIEEIKPLLFKGAK